MTVDWYASATHQGYHYYDGRGVIWEHQEHGTVIGKYLQAMECNQSYYILCYPYRRFENGDPFRTTSDGIMFVGTGMLTGEMVLVPLANIGNILPCLLVEERQKLLIVPAIS